MQRDEKPAKSTSSAKSTSKPKAADKTKAAASKAKELTINSMADAIAGKVLDAVVDAGKGAVVAGVGGVGGALGSQLWAKRNANRGVPTPDPNAANYPRPRWKVTPPPDTLADNQNK
jgi:hypothetical protein